MQTLRTSDLAPPLPLAARVRATDPAAGQWKETALLLLLALVTEIVYFAGFVVPYPLANNFTQPFLDLNRLNNHTPESANYFAVTWVISFALLYIAYRRCPSQASRSYIMALGAAALVFNLTILLMYPTGAADIFDQIFQARELAIYGKNPLLLPPADPAFAHDPFRPFIGASWDHVPSPYGPVWQLLSAGTALLAGADLWRALLFFKGLVILAYAGSCILVYATLRLVQPDWAARGLLFFAWNPLLIWETAGNGHNDIVMVFFTLLCCYLLARGGRLVLLAPAALALGVLSKYISLLILPLVLVAVWRLYRPARPASPGGRAILYAQIRAMALAGAGFLVVAVLLYLPFWYGPNTITSLLHRDLFTASIPNSLKDVLAGPLGLGEGDARAAIQTAAFWVVGAWVLLSTAWLFFRTRADSRTGILNATFLASYNVFFVYLVFGTLWFQPWYQSWIIGMAAITAGLPVAKRTLVLNAGGVANYFVWDFLVLWNNSWGTVIQWSAALAVNLPVLLYTLYQVLVPERAPRAYINAGEDAQIWRPPEKESTEHDDRRTPVSDLTHV
jgi:hypothetical protein